MYKQYPSSASSNNDEIDFGQQLHNLWLHKSKIATALIAGGLLGAVFSFASTPVYRADAMLEIETKQNQILTEINNMLSNEPAPSEAEIELVQSRMVIGKTVDELQLDQEVKATYFPVFGNMVHNLSGNDDPILKIGTFTVSEEWINKPFKLTVKDSKSYILTLPNGTAKEGHVGTPLKINNETVLKVDQILAETEQNFELTKFSKLSAIENIKNQLSVISKGKTSPIINLAYTDVDPK